MVTDYKTEFDTATDTNVVYRTLTKNGKVVDETPVFSHPDPARCEAYQKSLTTRSEVAG